VAKVALQCSRATAARSHGNFIPFRERARTIPLPLFLHTFARYAAGCIAIRIIRRMRNAVELRVIRSVDDEGVAVEGFGVSAATEFGIPAGPPNCYGSRTPHTHTHTRTHARTHAREGLIIKIKYCGGHGELASPLFYSTTGLGGSRRGATPAAAVVVLWFSPPQAVIYIIKHT
jgi:hypothetical protein